MTCETKTKTRRELDGRGDYDLLGSENRVELDGRGDYDLHRFRNKQKETLWKVKTWTRLQDVARFTHELACRRA